MEDAGDMAEARLSGDEGGGRPPAAAGGGPAGAPAGPPRKPPRLSGRNAYSVFVGLLKLLLPALAVALVLLVVVWPQVHDGDNRFRIGISELGPGEADSLSMVNARFEGVDDENRPFTITADVATQAAGEPDLIELQLPKADITLADGAWVALSARSGRYHRAAKRLELSGEVSLFHDRGFELHTTAAEIDLDSGVASGDRPVSGQGPSGTLAAEGFRVEAGGERIVFTGASRLEMRPAGGAGP